ncbi:TetR family transcriptional regulator OS=Streptomyces rimosus subsp. rimosus (strain ATCC /DSM 40260 / JCM 4667 / NRRL 2234) OX=1265868 GN=SRIM_017085 PE=4 SV=1 [Streptomyces rimosus subsp. rimosus]
MLAELYVDRLVMTASAFLDVSDGEGEGVDSERWRAVARTARRQLHLISVGRQHWHDAVS